MAFLLAILLLLPVTVRAEEASLPEDSAMVKVADYAALEQALCYATAENPAGQRLYTVSDAYLRYGTVKKLMAAQQVLEQQGLGLVLLDAFCPASAQAQLEALCPEAAGSPDRLSHRQGSGVDVALTVPETGERLPLTCDLQPGASAQTLAAAMKNDLLLLAVMRRCGFAQGEQWNHFTDTDSYSEAAFEPAQPQAWYVSSSGVGLFREPSFGTGYLGSIPEGAEVQVLGWSGKFALVEYGDQQGCAYGAYLSYADSFFADALSVVRPTGLYSYEQMVEDLTALWKTYPRQTAMEYIGQSEEGRLIPVLRIGSENAAHHVLLQGAMHGREHMTAWLLTALADFWLKNDILNYGYDVCLHIIPMTNPDGVTISQTHALNETQAWYYERDTAWGRVTGSRWNYAGRWKANALGVDLNRNFTTNWETMVSRSVPAAENYKGTAPLSAKESQVLAAYTLSYAFDAAVSYHATGSLIYYSSCLPQMHPRSTSLAQAVEEVTGYPLYDPQTGANAGYKDWAMEQGIPSITVEVGCNQAPLAYGELYSIFYRNLNVFPRLAQWAQAAQA